MNYRKVKNAIHTGNRLSKGVFQGISFGERTRLDRPECGRFCPYALPVANPASGMHRETS